MSANTQNRAARFRRTAATPQRSHVSDINPNVHGIVGVARTAQEPLPEVTQGDTSPKVRQTSAEGAAKAAHYKAISEQRRNERTALIENQKSITERLGLSYFHHGKITFAYKTDKVAGVRPGAVVTFATATCHTNDSFSKGMGAAYAAKAFAQGHWTQIKSPMGNGSARDFLKALAMISSNEACAIDMADEFDDQRSCGNVCDPACLLAD